MSAVELNSEVSGKGEPPLILAGSLGTTLRMWDPNTPGLERVARMIRIDHRGHGDSPVPPGPYTIDDLGRDVLALMDRLGVARASYCGLSIGGIVGMWLAANAPERIDRLILICTAPHMPPPAAWAERAATVTQAASTEPIADAVVARWFTSAFELRSPDKVASMRSMLLATDPAGYAGCCSAIERVDMRAQLAQITAPTLIIAGAQDPVTPPRCGRLIADAISDASFTNIEAAAHLASVEQPEQVNSLIYEHLDASA